MSDLWTRTLITPEWLPFDDWGEEECSPGHTQFGQCTIMETVRYAAALSRCTGKAKHLVSRAVPPSSAGPVARPHPSQVTAIRGETWHLRLAHPLIPLLGIVALAAALRLIGLTAISLWGDEYNSIDHATTRFWETLTSLVYSFILRTFLSLGDSVAILRFPAVIFGVAAVPAIYFLGNALLGRTTGMIAALLMAISSYAIGYSQLVRFYSLFLFSGILALHALTLLLRDGPSTRRIVWLLVANLLCLASQGLGILVIAGEILSYILLTASPHHAARRLIVLAVLAGIAWLIVSDRQVREWGFRLLARYTGSSELYTVSRGLHLSNLVKIPWTFYVFTYGERVYPVLLVLTVPGAVLVTILLVRAVWTLLHNNRFALGILVPPLVLAPLLLYMVMDALTSTGYQGASPRYLIPLLAPFLLLIAIGITSWRSQWAVALSLLLTITLNAATLVYYWQDAWNYNGYMPDYARAAALVSRDAVPRTVVLVDGRSSDPARYYLSKIEHTRGLAQVDLDTASQTSAGIAPRIIILAQTDPLHNQDADNAALMSLETHYRAVDGFVRYPQFTYVLDRMPAGNTPSASDMDWQVLPLPIDLYGLQLADLALPATLRTPPGDPPLITRGALSLAPSAGSNSRTFTFPALSGKHALLLATSLENVAGLRDGSAVATLSLAGPSSTQTIVLRKGLQVDDWQRVGSSVHPPGAAYITGYTWTKLVSLVGERSYTEAYRQFTAGIAVSNLALSGRPITSITVRYRAPTGTLHLWAAALR